MRLTFLTHFPGRGGSTSLLSQLADFFRSHGHAVSVIVGSDCEDPILRDYAVVPAASPWRERIAVYRTEIERTKPDLIYSISGKDEYDVLRFLQCPRVRHISSLEQNEYVDIPLWLRQMDGYTEAITANTPDVLEQIRLIQGHPGRNLMAPYRIAPVFFSVPDVGANPRPPASALQICFVGRLETFLKRVHWLPDAVARCKKAGSLFQWHIYGSGPAEASLKDQITKRGCEADVVFHGWLDAAALARELPQRDVCFFCSRSEGLPVAMVEAMLCGTACVAPEIRAGIYYLLGQGGGWMYQAHSSAHAANALLAATADRNLLYKKRVEAQTVARSLFNEQTVLVQLNELERQLVNLRFNGRALILNHAARMRPVPISVAVKRRLMRCISIVMGNPIPRT
ncbi:MAG: glycosyltransferase family 4 protein [Verrucomicrobiota bacterium]